MPSVRVRENEPFEVALRRFKRTIEKTGLLTELRAREFYEKPTAERKRKLAAAVKRHYKRLRSQQLPPKLYYPRWRAAPEGRSDSPLCVSRSDDAQSDDHRRHEGRHACQGNRTPLDHPFAARSDQAEGDRRADRGVRRRCRRHHRQDDQAAP